MASRIDSTSRLLGWTVASAQACLRIQGLKARPRMGYEMVVTRAVVDCGRLGCYRNPDGTRPAVCYYGRHEVTTYLRNDSGRLSVWSHYC